MTISQKALLSAVIAIVIALPPLNSYSEAPKQGGFSVKVETVKAEKKSVSQDIKTSGTLLANESVMLSSEVTGRVTEIPFKEGSEVKKGTTLFKLDSSVQLAQLSQAQANLELSQNNVNRFSELQKSGAISKVKLEEAQAELNSAKANVQLAQANLAKTTIRAPFDGLVGIRKVSVGDVIANGQQLVNVEQINTMRVKFTVPEKYISVLKAGQDVAFKNETSGEDSYTAKITAIEPKIDIETRSVAVQAIAENKEKKLYSGQFVEVTLSAQKHDDATVIPDQALISLGEKYFVFKVENDAAKKVEVTVGLRANSEAEILSGINAGDVVVTAGHQKLQDGVPVRVAEPTIVTKTPPSEEKQ